MTKQTQVREDDPPQLVRRRSRRAAFAVAPKTGLLLAVVAAGALGLWYVNRAMTPNTTPRDAIQWLAHLTGPVAVGLAVLLMYSLRRSARAWYGVVEVLVALIAGWNLGPEFVAGQLEHGASLVPWLTFLAAVYLGVRGLDNIDQGIALTAERERELQAMRHREIEVEAMVRAARPAGAAQVGASRTLKDPVPAAPPADEEREQ
jgi:hypothetical protein